MMHEATFDPIRAIESRIAERGRDTELEELQEEGKSKVSYSDGNSILGARQIEIARQSLEFGDDDFEWTRMAEGYALMGDYRKAFELTRDETKRKEYEEILNAHDALDCPCPANTKIGTPNRTPILQFAGRTLTRCTCGNLRC